MWRGLQWNKPLEEDKWLENFGVPIFRNIKLLKVLTHKKRLHNHTRLQDFVISFHHPSSSLALEKEKQHFLFQCWWFMSRDFIFLPFHRSTYSNSKLMSCSCVKTTNDCGSWSKEKINYFDSLFSFNVSIYDRFFFLRLSKKSNFLAISVLSFHANYFITKNRRKGKRNIKWIYFQGSKIFQVTEYILRN